MARPHVASIVEDAIHRRCAIWLRWLDWQPRAVAYTGYGSPEFARVLGRVLLSRSSTNRASGHASHPENGQRGWRAFLAAPAMDVPVTVTLGGHRTTTRSDRSGYVDVTIPLPDLEPGWHEATLAAEDAEPVGAPVHIIDPQVRIGLVSDIDDTVITTRLPRPLIAAWNTFVRHETARHIVPGMALLYRELLAEQPGAPMFYLSTGAWNVAPTLTRFLKRHSYPPGPLLLTDWGPTNSGWFRSGQEHKRTTLHRLAREFPQIRWTLIGDDGQHDPKIYSDFAHARPEAVETIVIRKLTPAEQVLSHGTPVSIEGLTPGRRRTAQVVSAPDGYGLRRLLRARRAQR